MEEVNGKEGEYGNEKENVDEIPQKNWIENADME